VIEVEKKFLITDKQLSLIKESTTFLKTETNNDKYYDYADFRLIKDRWWLRNRNGRFELKISRDATLRRDGAAVHDEIIGDDAICKLLDVYNLQTLVDSGELQVIGELTTERESYSLDKFRLDYDVVTNKKSGFVYKLLEIEIMVNSPNEIEEATQEITKLADRYNLKMDKPRGKVIEFLYQLNPEAYSVLEDSGLFDTPQ
jgi:adenylate cyclase class IV